MNLVVCFEDIPAVVRRFLDVHFAPQAQGVRCISCFVPFWDNPQTRAPLPALVVAQNGASLIKSQEDLEKIVVFMDLSPTLDPDRQYGLRVTNELSKNLCGRGAATGLLALPNRLVVILSAHLEVDMNAHFEAAWGPAAADIVQVRRTTHGVIADAVGSLSQASPRLAIADRVRDPEWAARTATEWLRAGR